MQTPDDDALTALIRRDATRHAPPAGLAERIAAQLRAAAALPAGPDRRRAVAPARRRWLESVLLFGAGGAAAWVASNGLLVLGVAVPTADDITASHVRSLMSAHLTDVASSDRHTVKPWFAGKLDFSPPVHDLADEGYALAGARLDDVAGRRVAALVYRQRQHVVNVFVWPAPAGPATPPDAQVRRGYHLVGWSQQGMQFWAVSDANAEEMRHFAQVLRSRVDAAAAQ